jgi:DNA-nicking Smr family endonuclease
MVGRKGRFRRRALKDEETALWQQFVRSIKPLRRSREAAEPASKASAAPEEDAIPPRGPEPAPAPSAPSAAPAAVPPLAPLGRRLRQRIGRGTHTIDARLDLHGMTQAKAHAALARFLRSAQAQGAKLVLVITGKGVRAGGEAPADRGVLRREVPRWLAEPEFRDYVVGFEAAHGGHGGEGALYIRVRRARS